MKLDNNIDNNSKKMFLRTYTKSEENNISFSSILDSGIDSVNWELKCKNTDV